MSQDFMTRRNRYDGPAKKLVIERLSGWGFRCDPNYGVENDFLFSAIRRSSGHLTEFLRGRPDTAARYPGIDDPFGLEVKGVRGRDNYSMAVTAYERLEEWAETIPTVIALVDLLSEEIEMARAESLLPPRKIYLPMNPNDLATYDQQRSIYEQRYNEVKIIPAEWSEDWSNNPYFVIPKGSAGLLPLNSWVAEYLDPTDYEYDVVA